ncbi:unnamed protein product, partial [Coregonus sp. 'balchen']
MDKIVSRHLRVNPRFLPTSNHCVLKSLLENPMKLPLLQQHEQQHEGFEKEREKEKNLDEERSAPQSAFLGPTLWNKTLPYDGDNFQLEYMDLDEFLSENGLPSELAVSTHHDQHQSQSQHQTSIMSQALPTPSPSVIDLSNHASASTSVHTSMGAQNCLPSLTRAALPSRNTPSPIDPESIQVPVSYVPDPADLVLSSVPGQDMFDPRKRKYWVRRKKNNVAAKRSRDARRLKENQIAIRAGFLEKENSALRMEVADLRRELGRTKNIVAKYQATHRP